MYFFSVQNEYHDPYSVSKGLQLRSHLEEMNHAFLTMAAFIPIPLGSSSGLVKE